MGEIPEDAVETLDIVRFLAMAPDAQLAAMEGTAAQPWVAGNPRPLADLIANFAPYPGMFDSYPGHSPERDAAHDLLMELVTCTRVLPLDDELPSAATFQGVEWSLLRRLARLAVEAFGISSTPFTRFYLFSY